MDHGHALLPLPLTPIVRPSCPPHPANHTTARQWQKDWPIYEQGAERAVAQINTWLDRIHVSLNDDLVPYFMDGIKVSVCGLVRKPCCTGGG